MNYSKPFVKVYNNDEWIPRGQRDNLPELFTSTEGDTYTIEDICELKSSKWVTLIY